ncbi:MAG: glycosyltransferase family 4 protein [Magnetococcales bacterium]|nr:glycosyltransferase family 4 protein [Magnetococcales bacterium]
MTPDAPIHVLQIYHTRYPRILGGIDTMLSHLMEGLVHQNRISLLNPGDWQQRNWSQVSHGGITLIHHYLAMPPTGPFSWKFIKDWLHTLISFPRSLLAMSRYCRQQQVTVIHLHTLHSYGFYVYLLAKLGGPPYIVTLHGTDVLGFGRHKGLVRRLIKRVIAGAGKLVTVSESMLEPARRQLGENLPLVAIANGLPPPATTSQPPSGRALPGRFALMVGWLLPPKGIEMVVRSWAAIVAEQPDLHFVHVGSGHQNPFFDEKIKALAKQIAPDHIHLLGALESEALVEIYDRAELFLMPSYSEGLSYAFLEATMRSIPVVLTRIPAFTLLAQEKTEALYCDVDGAEEFVKAVVQLAENPSEARIMGRRLGKKMSERYSAAKMCQAYQAIYEEFCPGFGR